MTDKRSTADAGFAADVLDPVTAAAIDRLKKAVGDVERIRGGLEPLLDEVRTRLTTQLQAGIADPALFAHTERMVDFLEKYARVALNLTKVTDELARLRSFVAGGADSRPDLGSLSDADLAGVITGARKTLKAEEK